MYLLYKENQKKHACFNFSAFGVLYVAIHYLSPNPIKLLTEKDAQWAKVGKVICVVYRHLI